MTFDLVVEAIKQLYKAFDEKYPLEIDDSVFKQAVSDDAYFKQIRACFAAHPVDLYSKDGTERRREKKSYFPSWSSGQVSGDIYSVYVYSINPSEAPYKLSIRLTETLEYISKRYDLLSSLIKIIKREESLFREELKKRGIPRDSSPIRQLQILLHENKCRIREGHGHHDDINTLLNLFGAPQNFPEGEKTRCRDYLTSLHAVIEDIYENLQNMSISDLSHGILIWPETGLKNKIDISNVFESIYNPTSPQPLLNHHLQRLVSAGLLPSFVTSSMDKRDLHLLLLTRLVNNTDEVKNE